jgi:beta propeller repeat protein
MKRRRATYRTLTLIIALSLLIPVLGRTETSHAELEDSSYNLDPGIISSTGTSIRSLSMSGMFLVWEDAREGEPDVLIYDLEQEREFRASNADGVRREPAVSGSLVVWLEGEDPHEVMVRGVDLAEDNEFDVTDSPARRARLAISSDLIAWQEWNGSHWEIQVVDHEFEHVATLGGDMRNNGRPSVSGSTVIWQAHDGESWNIHLFDAETNTEESVTASEHDDQSPSIDGETIVYVRLESSGGQPNLIVHDHSAGSEQTLTTEHFVQRPNVQGQFVVWEDWRSGLPDVYVWDLEAEQSFAVVRSQQANEPIVRDSTLAWVSGNDPLHQQVQTLEILERLPTDPQDPPAVPSSDALYIPETQQFVSSGFKSFWQEYGGPHFFGYPLTSEFAEEHPESGDDIIVQYFERAKLEYHPDAPEDERIRLALLGHELRPESQVEPVEPFDDNEFQRYFPQTGHAISYGFKEFWEENGGMAVFGYPITREFSENGRTVQYFERARFELDPESESDEVMLGLLGREALEERGWLPIPDANDAGGDE